MDQRRKATASEAMLAVSRVLAASAEAMAGPAAVHEALVCEARGLFEADGAMLLEVDVAQRAAKPLAADPVPETTFPVRSIDTIPALRELVDLRLAAAHATTDEVAEHGRHPGWGPHPGRILMVPLRSRDELTHVLVLVEARDSAYTPDEQELAQAFAGAAAGALAHLRLAEEHAERIAQLSALTRAAKTLNESLDLAPLLQDICREARSIVDADISVIYLGDAEEGLIAEAAENVSREQLVGYRLPPGHGLAGQVAQSGEAMLANDYQAVGRPQPDSPFADVQSAMAVPVVWNGELRGVLSLGYRRPFVVTEDELRLLATFAELAAAACRNADAATGLALAARTDGLTGCLNHAALQDGLRRELERSDRSGQAVSVILLDLDGFKQVNERHGHLVGDEVLRRVGHALRTVVRPYDLCARYGGDEFAIVCVDAGEDEAVEVAERALERLAAVLSEIDHVDEAGATAGVACRTGGESSTRVLDHADRALLYGKQEGARGTVVRASQLPQLFRPGRFRRGDAAVEELHRGTDAAPALEPGAAQAQRLQKRTRQLVLSNALATRLAGMSDVDEICHATVDELHRAFGYFLCAVIRIRDDGYVESAAGRGEAFVRLGEQRWSQPRNAGIIGRALRDRRSVLVNDIREDPSYSSTPETSDTRAELVAPLWVGDRLWGAINVEESVVDAFDDDDVRLVQTIADQVGAAIRSALLYERLERAYLGTAQALATALEAREGAGSTSAVVGWCEEVGRRLGLGDPALRDLRYAAALHDVGKLAVPDAILAKPGPLDDAERAAVERAPVVGEQILAPVEFLASARPLVRHCRERWDGSGYPDRLRGDSIPMGARIIHVCDAYGAMISERPYRAARTPAEARAELEREAGTQFDPSVVGAFRAVLDAATVPA